jgi:hypothetical protein
VLSIDYSTNPQQQQQQQGHSRCMFITSTSAVACLWILMHVTGQHVHARCNQQQQQQQGYIYSIVRSAYLAAACSSSSRLCNPTAGLHVIADYFRCALWQDVKLQTYVIRKQGCTALSGTAALDRRTDCRGALLAQNHPLLSLLQQ